MKKLLIYILVFLFLTCFKCKIPLGPFFNCGGNFKRSEKISMVYSSFGESILDIEFDSNTQNVYLIKIYGYLGYYGWMKPGYLLRTDLDFKKFKLISDTLFSDISLSSTGEKIAGLSIYYDSLTKDNRITILVIDTSGIILNEFRTRFEMGGIIEFSPQNDSLLYFSAYDPSSKIFKIYRFNLNDTVFEEISSGEYFTFLNGDSLVVSDYGYISYHTDSKKFFYVDFINTNKGTPTQEIFVKSADSEKAECLYIRPYYISYILRIEPHFSKNEIYFISTRLDWGPECLIEFDITEVWKYSF